MPSAVRLESPAAEAGEVLRFVREMSGEDPRECYQCGKCAAGCPVGTVVDLTPTQLLRALQLGDTDAVLDSRALWLCVGCHTCVTRCPCQVDLPRITDALRHYAAATGHPAAAREVAVFHRSFLEAVRRLGRSYEVGLIAMYNTLTGHLFASADLGPPMFLRGKLKLVPQRVQARAEVVAIFERAERMRERDRRAAREASSGAGAHAAGGAR